MSSVPASPSSWRADGASDTLMVAGVECFAWRPKDVTRRNFGDELAPIIARAVLTERGGALVGFGGRRLLSVGSVLHFSRPADVAWGSGVNGKIFRQVFPHDLDVRAVRGPLSRAVLLNHGIWVPPVFGDPALLLPRFTPELRDLPRDGGLVVVPNLNDQAEFSGADELLDPTGDVWDVVSRVARAEFVAATSLHALIIADALGIPSRPIVSTAEHPFKYLDYYAGTGRADVVFAKDVDDAVRLGGVAPASVDLDGLLASFPSDLWGDESEPLSGSHGAARPRRYIDLRNASEAQHAAVVHDVGWNVSAIQAAALVRANQLRALVDPQTLPREERGALDGRVPRESQGERAGILLSVVVPTHNVAPWVRETLMSIRAQNVPDMEIIIVDDHSTDGTKDILREIEREDDRVRVVDLQTFGGGAARNLGVDLATGRYLIFCDGDDLVPRGAYRALIASLEQSGSDIVFGDYLKFSPIDTWEPTANMPAYRRPAQGVSIATAPTLIYSRPCWNKAFRREFWVTRDIRFPDVPRSNDIVPMTKAYLFARAVDVVDDIVYLYRQRLGASSMTSRAGSAVSTASYFTQEIECAQLVVAAHSQSLDKVYAGLVYDRDGYVHLRQFLASWTASAQDDQVVSAVRRLVNTAPRPAVWLDPIKLRTFRLVAAGALAPAAFLTSVVAAHFDDAARDDGRHLRAFLERLRDDNDLTGSERAFIGERIAAWLTGAPSDLDDRIVSNDDIELAMQVFGIDLLRLLPELRDRRADEAPRVLGQTAATIHTVAGGGKLELTGVAPLTKSEFVPVLVSVDSDPAAADPWRIRDPKELDAVRDADGAWHWKATFAATDLPLHSPFVVASRSVTDGQLTGMRLATDLPEYTAKDAFLFRSAGHALAVERRRAWPVRAMRRALIIARSSVGRMGGSQVRAKRR